MVPDKLWWVVGKQPFLIPTHFTSFDDEHAPPTSSTYWKDIIVLKWIQMGDNWFLIGNIARKSFAINSRTSPGWLSSFANTERTSDGVRCLVVTLLTATALAHQEALNLSPGETSLPFCSGVGYRIPIPPTLFEIGYPQFIDTLKLKWTYTVQ